VKNKFEIIKRSITIKTIFLVAYFFLDSILISTAPVLAQDPNEGLIRSVDIEKIRKDKYTEFIDHVFWPEKELIASKRISKDIIPADMNEFKEMVSRVLKAQYLPPSEIVDANAIALEQYRYGSDYILLRYNVGNREIRIQECGTLYVAVIFAKGEPNEARPELAEYLKSMAFEVLNLPKQDKEGREPKVFISSLDIGESKCGDIHYDLPPPKFWYSYIRWWSDGKNVLFVIGKATFNGEDLNKRAGPPENLGKPRKFKKDS